MTNNQAVNWLINVRADIGKAEYRELWHYEQALAEISDLLSAEPERHGRWIPCSERLPEIIKGQHVSDVCIVYCDTGAYGFTILEENIFGQVGWQCERDDDYHEPLGEVIAWMPLPEPYKEGEQE